MGALWVEGTDRHRKQRYAEPKRSCRQPEPHIKLVSPTRQTGIVHDLEMESDTAALEGRTQIERAGTPLGGFGSAFEHSEGAEQTNELDLKLGVRSGSASQLCLLLEDLLVALLERLDRAV